MTIWMRLKESEDLVTQCEIILLEHEYIAVGKMKRDLVTRWEILLLARA